MDRLGPTDGAHREPRGPGPPYGEQAELVEMACGMYRRGAGLERVVARVREFDDSLITAIKAVRAVRGETCGIGEAVRLLAESPTWADRRDNLLEVLASADVDDVDDDPASR